MAVVEAGLPEMLLQLGTELHDEDLDESQDGIIKRSWAARTLDTAAREIARRIRKVRVPPSSLAPYEFTLSVDPADSDRYLLPRRARRVFYLKDDNGEYGSLDSQEYGRPGFVYEGRGVRIRNVTVTGDLIASVLQAPVTPSYGISAAGTGSTAVVLASTPTIGRTSLEPNYYVGALIAMESGAAIGEIRRVTAYDAATRTCTVSAFSAAPSAADTYTTILGIPDAMERAVVLRAAMIILRTDKSLDVDKDRILSSYGEAFNDGIADLKGGAVGHIPALRNRWNPGFDGDFYA